MSAFLFANTFPVFASALEMGTDEISALQPTFVCDFTVRRDYLEVVNPTFVFSATVRSDGIEALFPSFATSFFVSSLSTAIEFPTFAASFSAIAGQTLESGALFPPFKAAFAAAGTSGFELVAPQPTFTISLAANSGETATLDASFSKFNVSLTGESGGVASFNAVFDKFAFEGRLGSSGLEALFPAFAISFVAAHISSMQLEIGFEPFEFSAAIYKTETNTGAETWVVNIVSKAHSTYDAWDANSHGYFNGKELAIFSDGIYEITGTKDGVSDIDSRVYWAPTDLGTNKQKTVDSLSVNMRSLDQNEIRLAAIVDEEQKRVYTKNVEQRSEGLQRYRKTLPLGLQGQTWQFGFENVASGDFVIDDIEVIVADKERIFK